MFSDGFPAMDGFPITPVSGSYRVDQIRSPQDGNLYPAFRAITAQGGPVYFYLLPDVADQIAAQLKQIAAACRAHMIVPDDAPPPVEPGDNPLPKLLRTDR